MKKIKVAMMTDCLRLDGISNVIMNYCTHIDSDRFEMTIISGGKVLDSLKRICDESRIHLVELPGRKKSYMEYCRALNHVFKENEYDICHIHGNSATNTVELLIAKKNHIKVRIMHSHNSKCQHRMVHLLLLPVFRTVYTDAVACSSLAGNWIFGNNNFSVLPNGFETSRFAFNPQMREYYRKKLHLEDSYVLGYVGQINYQKNYWYIIKCFEKYMTINKSSKMLIVGTGREINELENYVAGTEYKEKIILYGQSDDIPGILSAMDVFLFPSRYEGLGISVIEAQISGLPCIASSFVPAEVKVGENVSFLPIDDESIYRWTEEIEKYRDNTIDRAAAVSDKSEAVSRYDIKSCVGILEELYMKTIERVK